MELQEAGRSARVVTADVVVGLAANKQVGRCRGWGCALSAREKGPGRGHRWAKMVWG